MYAATIDLNSAKKKDDSENILIENNHCACYCNIHNVHTSAVRFHHFNYSIQFNKRNT